MRKELLISSSPHETKVAVLEDDQVVEVYFQRDTDAGLVGGIYKGRVNRVLPGMQSAFVNIGLERDAFLYVSDFFEDSEEYDRVFTEAEGRAAKLTEPGNGGSESVERGVPLPDSNAEAAVADTRPQTRPAPILDTDSPAPAESALPEQAETSSSPLPSASSPSESKPYESPGRGSRRRGRRFRDFRQGNRREAGDRAAGHYNQPATQALELLPGESLAKYGNASRESSPAAGAEYPETGSGPSQESDARGDSLPEDADSNAAFGLDSVEVLRNAAPDESSPEVPEPLTPPSLYDRGTEEGEFPSPDSPRSFPQQESDKPPDQPSSVTDQQELGLPEQPSTEPTVGESLEDAKASAPSRDLFKGTDTETAANGNAESEDTPSRAPTPEEPPQFSSGNAPGTSGAGHSYTLRESSHRPHMAPRRGRRGRGRFRGNEGRRRDSGSGRPPAPSRAGNYQPLPINELLKEGQEILVQIAKEPLGAKGARITSHIALPGRYLVYMPTIDHIGVSRKIGSEEERLRLRNIIIENRGTLTGGFIVRTAGAGRPEEELKADLAFLSNTWNEIRAKAERVKAPALLHRDLTLVERVLRDLLSPDFRTVRVDNELEYEHILDFVNRFQPSLIGHVKLYTRETPLFEEFGAQAEIDRALKPKVWLKSGGYIVINQTEALVAIDVNTGKYVGKTNRLEDTIVRTNIDAVREIVRQIRLRDLGGIIVIDFIDMDERRNRAKVVQALEDALHQDRAPTKILSFNEFGLVALTRKRVKHSLERTLCDPCPYCAGAGWIKSVATVSYDILAEARKMAAQVEGGILHLRVNPDVAAALKARDGILISEIEASTGKDVVIKPDPNVHQEQFEIY